MWRMGAAAHLIYCSAMAASATVLAQGRRTGAITLAAQLVPGMFKGWRRAALARQSMPESRRWFRRYGWAHWLLTPAATWIWLIAFLGSAATDTIEWRGYRYRLKPHTPQQAGPHAPC
jgi:hypothetical protein